MVKLDYIIPSCLFSGVFDCHNYLSRGKVWNIINHRRYQDENKTFKDTRRSASFISKGTTYGLTQEGKAFEKWKSLNSIYHSAGTLCYTNHIPTTLAYDSRFGASPDTLVCDAKLNHLLFGAEFKNPYMKDIPYSISKSMVADILQCVLCMEAFNVPEWHLFYYKEEKDAYSWFLVKRNEKYFKEILHPEAEFFLSFEDRPSPPPASFRNRWSNSVLEHIPVFVMGIKRPVS